MHYVSTNTKFPHPNKHSSFHPARNRQQKNVPDGSVFLHTHALSAITTKSGTDKVLTFLPISALPFSRVAGAILLHRALI